jgi:hypothetical protein
VLSVRSLKRSGTGNMVDYSGKKFLDTAKLAGFDLGSKLSAVSSLIGIKPGSDLGITKKPVCGTVQCSKSSKIFGNRGSETSTKCSRPPLRSKEGTKRENAKPGTSVKWSDRS